MTATATAATKAVRSSKLKNGRPKLAKDELRGATIGVRLSAIERAILRERAAAAGVKPAQLLRLSAFNQGLPPSPAPAVNLAEYARLAGLATNINQLARHANAGAAVTVDPLLLDQILAELSRLRLALVGVR